MRFPNLRGRSLAGSDINLPEGLAGDTNVILLAFRQRHQSDIDAWIGALGDAGIATSPPHDQKGRVAPGRIPVVLYEVPLIGARWQPARSFIDGGMAASIRAPEVFARTVTVYGQIGEVERALDVPNRDQVIAVVERDRDVLAMQRGWSGHVDDIAAAALG